MGNTGDIILDETGDVTCINGDFVIGDGTTQHQRDLLLAGKGEYKESPLIGVGIMTYILDEDKTSAFRIIRREFISDGMKVDWIKYDQGIQIKASYQ